MPFVTEEIWKNFDSGDLLIIHGWPKIKATSPVTLGFDRLKEIIEKIRNWRAENKVEPKEKINLTLVVGEYFEVFKDEINLEIIKTMARVENLNLEENPDSGFGYQFRVDRQIDTEKERTRLTTELEELEKYISSLETKLTNQELISKAPAHVVDGMKQKQDEAKKKAEALKQQIENL
jgi:valyl-tRNA synthetase